MNLAAPEKKTPLPAFLLHLVSLAGIGVAATLTQHFYDLRNGTAGFKSFCDINQTFNCDIVTASSHSELAFGLPVSSFAAGWFLALFLVSLFLHNPFWRRESLRAVFGMSLFGLLFSLPYLWIMATQLRTYCLYCLIVDGLSFTAVTLSLLLKPEGFAIHKIDFSKWKVFLTLIPVSLLISIVGLKSLDNGMNWGNYDLAADAESILTSQPLSVNTTGEYPSIGPANAPITVVEFSDFQCPFCRMGALSLNAVMNRFPGKIRIVFRNFPLDQSCNPSLGGTAHPIACEAARVAVCSHKEGRFQAVYEKLFEDQASFAPGRPLEIAKQLGLDASRMQGCAASPETGVAIAKDIEEASLLGVKSTPTFFVNGHRVEGVKPVALWNVVIEKLLLNHPPVTNKNRLPL